MLFKQPDLFLIFLEMWNTSIQTRKSDYCNRLSHLWKLYVIKITLRDFNYSSSWKVRIIVVCLLHFFEKSSKVESIEVMSSLFIWADIPVQNQE